MINRRSLITGLVSFVAAPAIVRVSSLMPVKAIKIDPYDGISLRKITEYDPTNLIKSIDISYGYVRINAQWLELFNDKT